MGRKAVSYLLYNLSIVFTLLLLAAAVVCWRASFVSPEQGGFWSTMALLMPVVLLVNFAGFVWWLVLRKWILSLFPLIALGLNLGYISAMVQLPDYSSVKTPHDIRIATLNTNGFRWAGDYFDSLNQIVSAAEAEQLDVFCMQEFTESRKFPADSIGKLFAPWMPHFVSEGSIAIASSYPIIAHEYVRFPDTNNDYLWADLQIGDQTVRVISVHLQTTGIAALRHSFKKDYGQDAPVEEMLGALDRNGKIRVQQVRDIRAVIDSTTTPVILAGDFNDTPSSYTYRTMKGTLTDGFQAVGKGYGGTYRLMGGVLRIDYIFYNDAFEGIRYYTSDKKISDHKMVIADLRLRQ